MGLICTVHGKICHCDIRLLPTRVGLNFGSMAKMMGIKMKVLQKGTSRRKKYTTFGEQQETSSAANYIATSHATERIFCTNDIVITQAT